MAGRNAEKNSQMTQPQRRQTAEKFYLNFRNQIKCLLVSRKTKQTLNDEKKKIYHQSYRYKAGGNFLLIPKAWLLPPNISTAS